MITEKNLTRHELIGLHAAVIGSKNKADIGICGKIIDETRDTLVLRDQVSKRIFKKNVRLDFELPSSKQVTLDGEKIVGRPWDRIKKG